MNLRTMACSAILLVTLAASLASTLPGPSHLSGNSPEARNGNCPVNSKTMTSREYRRHHYRFGASHTSANTAALDDLTFDLGNFGKTARALNE